MKLSALLILSTTTLASAAPFSIPTSNTINSHSNTPAKNPIPTISDSSNHHHQHLPEQVPHSALVRRTLPAMCDPRVHYLAYENWSAKLYKYEKCEKARKEEKEEEEKEKARQGAGEEEDGGGKEEEKATKKEAQQGSKGEEVEEEEGKTK
ncbi:hypothetical protein MMC06_005174 [Schaereria dolodes]|nr:hypothetical protein [Schaereria dolodes]